MLFKFLEARDANNMPGEIPSVRDIDLTVTVRIPVSHRTGIGIRSPEIIRGGPSHLLEHQRRPRIDMQG